MFEVASGQRRTLLGAPTGALLLAIGGLALAGTQGTSSGYRVSIVLELVCSAIALASAVFRARRSDPRRALVSGGEGRRVGSEMQLAVIDQGRGIPADQLAIVFERFAQVETDDARVKGGTGLGLTISRALVHLLGGRIWAESELGQGTTIRLTLPLVHPDEEGSADATD